VKQRRFSRARRTHDTDELAFGDLQVQPSQHGHFAERLVQLGSLDRGGHGQVWRMAVSASSLAAW